MPLGLGAALAWWAVMTIEPRARWLPFIAAVLLGACGEHGDEKRGHEATGGAGHASTGGSAGTSLVGGNHTSSAGAATGGTRADSGAAGSPQGAGGVPLAGGTGGVDCTCVLGAYIPACGVDGVTWDATCGLECVPVEIDCMGTCPCSVAGTGGTGGNNGDGPLAGRTSNGGSEDNSSGGTGDSTGGAGGTATGVRCGDTLCAPSEYCQADCNGTGEPLGPPRCQPTPEWCIGDETCECICGGFTQFCTPGAPAIQCGCP